MGGPAHPKVPDPMSRPQEEEEKARALGGVDTGRRAHNAGPDGTAGSVEMPGPVERTHLDDEVVLQHGIPHHPQPLVLHPGPEVGHGQGPPDRREDLAWGAAHRRWLRLQGTFQVLFSGAHKFSHRGGSWGAGAHLATG